MISYYPPRYLLRRHPIISKVGKGDSFLEIGAGNLKLSVELLRHFKEGNALDFSGYIEAFYKDLDAHVKQRLKLITGDFMHEIIRGQFDVIVTCEVLEHVENESFFLEKAYKLLKPSGKIIISVPARMKYWSIHDEIVGHKKRYERAELEAALKSAGFTEVEVISYGYPIIHIFRLARILLARHQKKEKLQYDKRKQTEVSGAIHLGSRFDFLGLLINKYTFYPLTSFSKLFYRTDLSDGYVAIARK